MDANPYNREKLTEDVLKEWQNLSNSRSASEVFCLKARGADLS